MSPAPVLFFEYKHTVLALRVMKVTPGDLGHPSRRRGGVRSTLLQVTEFAMNRRRIFGNDLGHIRNVPGHLWRFPDTSGTLLDRIYENRFFYVLFVLTILAKKKLTGFQQIP